MRSLSKGHCIPNGIAPRNGVVVFLSLSLSAVVVISSTTCVMRAYIFIHGERREAVDLRLAVRDAVHFLQYAIFLFCFVLPRAHRVHVSRS